MPVGYRLSDGPAIRSLLHAGEDWQIYSTADQRRALIARSPLADRWVQHGFLEEALLKPLPFGSLSLRVLVSSPSHRLEPVEEGWQTGEKADALAFALALRASRQVSADVSFHDAVYVEQYSRLLPVWSISPPVDDRVVLGAWLSGGVPVSVDSFRRLVQLAGRIPSDELAQVVRSAGFAAPDVESPAETTDRPQGQAIRMASGGAAPEFRLPGRPRLETFFNEHVIDIIRHADRYRALGIESPAAIVLHGPPGCGKTYAVERLVEYLEWPCYSINSSSVGSPYIHDTSRKVSEVFDTAIDNAPSVVVIDEMEAFLTHRRLGTASGLHHVEEVDEFLRRIPEATAKGVLVIAMTNMIELIDPAVLRRGRFDHIIEVGMPSREEVASLIAALLEKLPVLQPLALDRMITALVGRPLSDAAFLVREAARLAVRAGKDHLDQQSLDEALRTLPVLGVVSRPRKEDMSNN